MAVIPKEGSDQAKLSHEMFLSVSGLSKENLSEIQSAIAVQKRILVNLRTIEYKLARLELFWSRKGISSAKNLYQKSTPLSEFGLLEGLQEARMLGPAGTHTQA
ncbi:hypothetical protein FKM82_002429 [Ascaphus truei]